MMADRWTVDVDLQDHHKARTLGVGRSAGVVIHRLSPDIGETPREVDEAFRRRRFNDHRDPGFGINYSGLPYPLGVLALGGLWQGLPLDGPGSLGWHAYGASKSTIGICCLGDFRSHAATQAQWDSAVSLAVDLMLWRGLGCWVAPHDKVENGTTDPDKECPGKWFRPSLFCETAQAKVDDIRIRVAGCTEPAIREWAGMTLRRRGIVLRLDGDDNG